MFQNIIFQDMSYIFLIKCIFCWTYWIHTLNRKIELDPLQYIQKQALLWNGQQKQETNTVGRIGVVGRGLN